MKAEERGTCYALDPGDGEQLAVFLRFLEYARLASDGSSSHAPSLVMLVGFPLPGT